MLNSPLVKKFRMQVKNGKGAQVQVRTCQRCSEPIQLLNGTTDSNGNFIGSFAENAIHHVRYVKVRTTPRHELLVAQAQREHTLTTLCP